MLYIKRVKFTELVRELINKDCANWAISDLFITAECCESVPETVYIFKTGAEHKEERINARIHNGDPVKIIAGSDIFQSEPIE